MKLATKESVILPFDVHGSIMDNVKALGSCAN